jgi:hypothetical protein
MDCGTSMCVYVNNHYAHRARANVDQFLKLWESSIARADFGIAVYFFV